MTLLLVPLVLQALATAVDEAWYHRRRGLPRWERIGHPLDTLTVAATYAWGLAGGSLAGYVALASFSCLFVTKDEVVHQRACASGEHWVHALLFVLHPIVFLAVALLLRDGRVAVVALLLAATIAWGLYQLVHWNRSWKRAR
jgi:hypothetical protein